MKDTKKKTVPITDLKGERKGHNLTALSHSLLKKRKCGEQKRY
jgi:hypothetical protein